MESKFRNIDIDKLTEQECKEVLKQIRKIVFDFPSFISWIDHSYRENYICCTGSTSKGHDKSCTIRLLTNIFS